MKKYIAFTSNGNSKEGTYEEALAWATKMLNNHNHKVNIAEVIAVVERQVMPIVVRRLDEPELPVEFPDIPGQERLVA